jgi:hypothetical protein
MNTSLITLSASELQCKMLSSNRLEKGCVSLFFATDGEII